MLHCFDLEEKVVSDCNGQIEAAVTGCFRVAVQKNLNIRKYTMQKKTITPTTTVTGPPLVVKSIGPAIAGMTESLTKISIGEFCLQTIIL